jgi:S1-C subfamily serine protease
MRILLLALAVVSCARPEVTAPSSGIPASVDYAVQYKNDSGATGWAAPYALGKLVTVAHILHEQGGQWRTADGSVGPATVAWKDHRKDIAVLIADDDERHLFPLIQFAGRLPERLEPVFFRFYLIPGGTPVVGRGYFLGVDSDGDLVIDGMSHPGGSGSPVFNSSGKCFGAISKGFNQSALSSDELSSLEAIQLLNKRTSFRAAILASSLVGGVPERPRD